MQTEKFLIEVLCDDTGIWHELEISPNPYPVKGSDADELVSAGSLWRWSVVPGTARKPWEKEILARLKAERLAR